MVDPLAKPAAPVIKGGQTWLPYSCPGLHVKLYQLDAAGNYPRTVSGPSRSGYRILAALIGVLKRGVRLNVLKKLKQVF